MMNRSTALLLAALVAAPAARADKLDTRLHEEAPKVVQKLLDGKYANVGVLRFKVEAPGVKPGYATPLSGNLVTRVETGLILHAERDGRPALGVTRDTGAAAAKLGVGDWASEPAERRKLFAGAYPLAWGKAAVEPDAFLTGSVKVSKDLKETTLTLQLFDKADPAELRTLTTITVPTDRNVLRDLGVSFALPSGVRERAIKLKKKEPDVDADAIETVGDMKKEKEKAEDRPKNDTKATPDDIGGVAVRLLADDEAAAIREAASASDAIRWQVESPAEGQKVAFELTNTTDRKLAVVLRLNGVNVVNSQTLEPEVCGKVILLPGKKAVVRGFLDVPEDATEGAKPTVRPFVVVVGDEARKVKETLGEKAGLIDLDVFETGSAAPRGQVSQRGLPPTKADKARETYKGLKTALLQSSGLKTTTTPAGGGVKSREMIVAKTDGERPEVAGGGVTTFANPSFVARVTIKIVPRAAK